MSSTTPVGDRAAATAADQDHVTAAIDSVTAPHAVEVDRTGNFPREGVEALGRAGLVGLVERGLAQGGILAEEYFL